MTSEATAAPRGTGALVGWAVWLLLSAAAAGGGAALPWFIRPPHAEVAAKSAEASRRPAVVPFGEVRVNLGEERLTRYLHVKILLVVDEKHAKEVSDVLTQQKAFLKSWLIAHLADQSLQEVSRAAGVNRVRREVRDQFNAMLFPDGSEKIQDLLFDEFVVQ